MVDMSQVASADVREQEAGKPEGLQKRKTRLRRKAIFDIAAEAFSAQGYHNTSLMDIASKAGITPAGLLHHFKTKDVLLTELLEWRDAENIAEVRLQGELRGLAFLSHLVDTARLNEERRSTTRLYAVLSAESLTDDHPAQPWFRARYEGLRGMIETAVAEAVADGQLTAGHNGPQTAMAIIAVMDGLQLQWLLAPNALDMGEVTLAVIEALLGMRLPPATAVSLDTVEEAGPAAGH